MIFEAQPIRMQEVIASYEGDNKCIELISQLLVDQKGNSRFQLVQDMLKMGQRVVIGKDT